MVKVKDKNGDIKFVDEKNKSKNGLSMVYDETGSTIGKINLKMAIKFGTYRLIND